MLFLCLKETCHVGNALRILKDLVVLTVALGKGEMDHDSLEAALEQALLEGCNRMSLDKAERSQLFLAFLKVSEGPE